MPLTLDDVVTPTTADEIEAEVLSLCATGGLPTTSWQSGSVVRTLIRAISEEIATRALIDIESMKGGLGDLASPEWAKLWAQTIYNVIFVPAKPATGYVTFTNSEPTNYDRDPGEVIVAHSVTGKTYRNQAAVSIPASGSLANVPIQADEVGTDSDAAPGEISRMVTSLVGVTVTNPAAVLGANEETTVALVARTRAKLGSLSPNGPKEAYNYVATTPELSATSSPITRTRTVADPLTGEVTVYIATATGAPSGPDVAIVQTAIDTWAEPWCVMATAVAASVLSVDVTYQIWIRTTFTSTQVQTAIAVALTRYLASVPVGGVVGSGVPADAGFIHVEALQYIIHTALPGTQRVLVTLPVADIAVSPNQVPILGTVVPTVTLI